jgi:hypothetical protein
MKDCWRENLKFCRLIMARELFMLLWVAEPAIIKLSKKGRKDALSHEMGARNR